MAAILQQLDEVPGFVVPVHRALTEHILLGGAPRSIAIMNGTLAGAVGLGLRLWLDTRLLARLGAIVFVAIAITATAIEMTRKEEPPVRTAPALQPPADPLRASLRRCQQLGEAAANDSDCLEVWAQSRDRFLGRTSAPAAPQFNEGP